MLERETDTMIRTLTERTIGSAKSLALKDALAANIPAGIKAYLHCEVTRWMQDDLREANHFASFRFTTPFVHKLTSTYTRTLALEYIFTREAFVTAMENAVHFVENYLCRPQWTLEHFLFEKSDRVSLIELQTKFEYLAHYLYYAKLIEGFMQQKGWQEIGVRDFRSLLTKIDDQIVKQHNPKELAQLTRPIFEFLLLKSEISNTPVSIKPLMVFFEDKKMTASKEYIERICHIRGWEQLTIEQLGEILKDLPSRMSNKFDPMLEADAGVGSAEENQRRPSIPPQREPDRVPVETFTA
ncbi:MAG TPA: hypothetical protein DGH68_03260, partial [Bacteroidetes bacterium]|nr:hypothetical protein [Bacteroidota bacterium]